MFDCIINDFIHMDNFKGDTYNYITNDFIHMDKIVK